MNTKMTKYRLKKILKMNEKIDFILFFYHVSVLEVKIPSIKASGGIHLTGSMARPPFL